MHSGNADVLRHFNTSEWRGVTGASKDEIEATEQALGVALPADYRAFLRRFDGGEGSVGEAYLVLWGLAELREANDGAWQTEWPGLIAIGGDGGGERYALDYRQGEVPRVVAIDLASADPNDIWTIGESWSRAIEHLARSGGVGR